MSQFQTPITIHQAIQNIEKRFYLLPAIQRKFVWYSTQIEKLFDSIMRDYPINSFMFWKIAEDNIKNNFKFYEFLKTYRQFYKDNNEPIDTKSFRDCQAVIDGQQRLTSLYIGLKGSYAYKMPRKWWADNETCLPTRYLYLNLSHSLDVDDKDNERNMLYDFEFLNELDDSMLIAIDTGKGEVLQTTIGDFIQFLKYRVIKLDDQYLRVIK